MATLAQSINVIAPTDQSAADHRSHCNKTCTRELDTCACDRYMLVCSPTAGFRISSMLLFSLLCWTRACVAKIACATICGLPAVRSYDGKQNLFFNNIPSA